jgi:hypothetical protein
MTGDEASGVTVPDESATAGGAGTPWSSGATGTTGAANEFVFGTVAVFGGTSPTFASGWTGLSTYSSGTNYLGRGYRIAGATGTFTATGTTSGSWLSACVTFR